MEKIEIQQLDNHFLNGENYLFGTTTISRIKFLINYSILQFLIISLNPSSINKSIMSNVSVSIKNL